MNPICHQTQSEIHYIIKYYDLSTLFNHSAVYETAILSCNLIIAVDYSKK